MTPLELAQWQWRDYARFHQDRTNLIVHLLAVPLFWLGTAALLWAVARHRLPMGAAGAIALVVSLAMQGKGHRLEQNPPVPFSSRRNAVARILMEQFVTFPRYVLSGRAFSRRGL